jgi:hypothetical protein
MISTRLAPATLALLCLALVPVGIHTYVGATYDDGVRVTAIPEVLDGMRSEPEKRNSDWGKRRFGSDEWFDRWYGVGARIRLTVVRTYDPKAVYHHPELAVSYPGATLGRATRESLVSGDPVFLLRGIDGHRDLVIYALVSDGQVVGNPYLFQVTLGLKTLAGGRRPMTLVYVQDPSPSAVPLSEQPSVRLLERALALACPDC